MFINVLLLLLCPKRHVEFDNKSTCVRVHLQSESKYPNCSNNLSIIYILLLLENEW